MPSVVLNPDANDSIPNQTSVTNDKPPAPGVVPPSQSLDPQALVQSLKDILARDASGAAHTRELREVAYRLSIALERPGDTVQRVAYYVREDLCFNVVDVHADGADINVLLYSLSIQALSVSQ